MISHCFFFWSSPCLHVLNITSVSLISLSLCMSPVFYPSPIISRVSVPSISPLLSFHSSLIYLLLFYLPHTAFFLSFFLSSVLLFSSSILFSFSLFFILQVFPVYFAIYLCLCIPHSESLNA